MLFKSACHCSQFRWYGTLLLVSLGLGSWLMCSNLQSALAAQSGSEQQAKDVEHRFQTALTLYRAGNFIDAQQQLQALYKTDPNSFEINELTGLTYAALGRDEDA